MYEFLVFVVGLFWAFFTGGKENLPPATTIELMDIFDDDADSDSDSEEGSFIDSLFIR